MNTHLSPATIASYFADALSDDDQLAVEAHVSDCDACALDSQDLLATGTVVDRVVDGWTARKHGYAAARDARLALVEALERVGAQATSASLRARLAAWADTIAAQAEAAVRVVLDAPGQAAYRIATQAADLARPSAPFAFSPAPSALPIRGPAPGGAPRSPAQPIVVRIGGAHGPTAQVAVSGGRREVVVRLDDVPRGSEPPLVLLAPAEPRGGAGVETRRQARGMAVADEAADFAAGPPQDIRMTFAARAVEAESSFAAPAPPPPGPEARLAVPTPSPGSAAWIARFEGLPPGEYLLLFEPSAGPTPQP